MKTHLLLFLFIAIPLCVSSQTITNNLSDSNKEFILKKTIELPNQTQIAFGIINNNKVSYYGVVCKNDSIYEIENHTKAFEIGSLSKVFTATLLVNSVLEKKVKLEDNINKYLDFKLYRGTKITFKQLANHTSGLPRLPSNLHLRYEDPLNPYKNYNELKLKEYLSKEMVLASEAGKEYAYSNLGAGLLGYVLTKIENKTYEELLQEKILNKYKMTNSTSVRNKVKTMLIAGRNENGRIVPNWDLSVLVGAGGILSTVEDLTLFMSAQLNPKNLELALTREKTSKVNPIADIGLGWHIVNRKSGETWHQHNGGTGGYTATILMNTIKNNGVIILSNISSFSSKSSTIRDLSFGLMKSLN